MFLIRVLSGRINPKSRQLSWGTKFKMWLSLWLAKLLQQKNLPYGYVFPQGRTGQQKGQRPCDLMSLWIMKKDPRCWSVVVPESGIDLVTRAEKLAFVKAVADKRKAIVVRNRDFRKVDTFTFDEDNTDFGDVYLSNVISIRPENRV